MALHPVHIALERVDFAVMRQHAERLCQPPLREGICRIALVIQREGGFKAFVHKIRVKDRDLFGQHHAFVDDRAARERCKIKPRDTRSSSRFFNTTTDHIEFALKGFFVHTLGVGNQDLFNLWTGRVCLVAKTFDFYGNMTPSIDEIAHA